MSDSENYKVMKNEETGAEVYQCNICNAKYGTKKAMKTHNTTKHKTKKKTEEKTDQQKDDSEFVFEGEVNDTFGKSADFAFSTQAEKSTSVEDIARFYESGRSEFLSVGNESFVENNGTPETVIPDDTIEKIMTDIEEETTNETLKESSTEEHLKEDLFTENMLLISRLASAENSTKEKEQKILELVTSLIYANTEVSKLNEDK